MAQTVSGIEKEREKILAAIDEHAKQFSTQRDKSNEASSHNLSDWLNAAEEVVTLSDEASGTSRDKMRISADSSAKKSESRSLGKSGKAGKSGKSQSQAARSKASFFGVVLMLCLLFTVMGVVYLAYVYFEKEVELIHQAQQDTLEKFELLEAKLDKFEKDIATGGDSALFDSLVKRLDSTDEAIAGLQHLEKHSNAIPELTGQLDSLEKRVNLRITGLLNSFDSAKRAGNSSKPSSDSAASTAADSVNDLEVAQPSAPSEPQVPVVEQKLVKLVETKDSPDVAWLKSQKPDSLVLQLSSVPKSRVKDLQQQVADKNIENSYLIPQKVGQNQTNYVLVVGSFATRQDANKVALEIKKSAGMEAWIRPAKDLVERLDP